MAQVFISFAPEDRAWVRHLADALTGAGFEVFWDITPGLGRAVSVDIDAELAKANAVVAVWSAASRNSNWVRDVAQEAQEQGSLLPVLKDIERPPLGFRQLRCADLRGWPSDGANADALAELIAQLRERIPHAQVTDVDLERSTIILHDRSRDPSASFAAPTAGPLTAGTPTATESTGRSLPRAVARVGGAGDLRPGDEIGQYRVVRRLGAGGFGAVYEAANIHNEDERVALKLLLTDIASSERFAQLLKLEANALLRLKHPAVVQYRVFGRIADTEQFYLVTEFIPGPTLRDWRRENVPTMGQLRLLAIRLAQGLAAAHRRGIVHRDLAPDNVIVAGGEIGEATLIDFGIARMGDSDALGGAFAGKFSYAAPEQFDFDGERLGPAIDIYSFGLLLAAFVRGRPLDMGRDIDAAREHRRAVPPLDTFPEVLRAPLAALLQPSPQDRPRNMDEVARLFDHLPDTDEPAQLLSAEGGPTPGDAAVAAAAPDSEPTRTSLASVESARPREAAGMPADATIVQPPEAADPPHVDHPEEQPGPADAPAAEGQASPPESAPGVSDGALPADQPLDARSDTESAQLPQSPDASGEPVPGPEAGHGAGEPPELQLAPDKASPGEAPPPVATLATPSAAARPPLDPRRRRSPAGLYAAAAVVVLIAAVGAVAWWPTGDRPQLVAGDPNTAPSPTAGPEPRKPAEPTSLLPGAPASPPPPESGPAPSQPASGPPEMPPTPAPAAPSPEPAVPPAPQPAEPNPPQAEPAPSEPQAEPAVPVPAEGEPSQVEPEAGPVVPVPGPKPAIPAEPVPQPEPQGTPQPPPQPAPQPPAPAPPPAATGNELDQALEALSGIRSAAGVRPVKVDRNLVRVALALAQNDAAANAYVPPSGSAVLNLLIKSGYGNARATQNHARRQKSVRAVFETWRQQAGIAPNLVDPGVVAMGFAGAVAADGTPYWVLILAYPP